MSPEGKPRILFVSHSAGLYGAERSLLTLLDGLREIDYADIAVLLPGPGALQQELQSRGIKIHIARYYLWIGYTFTFRSLIGRLVRAGANLLAAFRVRRWIRTWNPDLVYSNSLASPMGLLLANFLSKPHIWHARELVREGLDAHYDFGERLAMSLLNRGTDKIICNSAAVAEKMACYLPKSKLAVVYNGFDFSGAAPPPAAEKYDRAVANAPTVRLAIIGSVQPIKGQEDGINALAILLAEGLPVSLEIIGDGPPVYLDHLHALASRLSITDNVRFRGYLQDIAKELEEIAVTLAPSRFEAFGRTAVESLARGTPVVAAAAGGLPEIVSDGRTGMLYPPGNHIELAAKIGALLRDRELYVTLSKNGRGDVTQRFTHAKYISGVQAAISEVLASR